MRSCDSVVFDNREKSLQPGVAPVFPGKRRRPCPAARAFDWTPERGLILPRHPGHNQNKYLKILRPFMKQRTYARTSAPLHPVAENEAGQKVGAFSAYSAFSSQFSRRQRLQAPP